MSMSIVLEFTQNWLRDKYKWRENECGVQQGAIPPQDAGYFYVAIDEAGVEAGPNDLTDDLKEICSIIVGIWMRPEHLQPDNRNVLKLPSDKWLIGSWNLNTIERAVIVHKGTGIVTYNDKHGLNRNYAFLREINRAYGLPSQSLGAPFIQPFRYKGRGTMESMASDFGTGEDPAAWFGYRLRFRGMDREQKIRNENDAVG